LHFSKQLLKLIRLKVSLAKLERLQWSLHQSLMQMAPNDR